MQRDSGCDLLPFLVRSMALGLARHPGYRHETRVPKSHKSLIFVCLQKDVKQCCDATTLESIHTKDESKCGIAFAFIFGLN